MYLNLVLFMFVLNNCLLLSLCVLTFLSLIFLFSPLFPLLLLHVLFLFIYFSLYFLTFQPYEGLKLQDLRRLKDMLIVETADMLQAPLFTAEALLRAHGVWKLTFM